MVNKVLVVDDNPTDLKRLETVIGGAGYQVISANNGQQAVDTAKSHKPDAIFMDVNMPGMDGFAATRSIMGNAETKSIPIILVTSKDQKADKAWGQMLGAKAYVTKPYTEDDILQQLKAL